MEITEILETAKINENLELVKARCTAHTNKSPSIAVFARNTETGQQVGGEYLTDDDDIGEECADEEFSMRYDAWIDKQS